MISNKLAKSAYSIITREGEKKGGRERREGGKGRGREREGEEEWKRGKKRKKGEGGEKEV